MFVICWQFMQDVMLFSVFLRVSRSTKSCMRVEKRRGDRADDGL